MIVSFIDIKKNIVIIIFGLLLLISLNCEKDNAINNPTAEDIVNQDSLTNDKYEPNDFRSQAYKLESIPFQRLEGVLINKNDIDWYEFSITDNDTGEIKFMFEMKNMTEKLGIQGCLYDKTEVPKGCFKIYKGLESNSLSSFGWQCTSGDYYFFIKVDTSYEKDAGKYCFDITK